jgi:hypothetical protein
MYPMTGVCYHGEPSCVYLADTFDSLSRIAGREHSKQLQQWYNSRDQLQEHMQVTSASGQIYASNTAQQTITARTATLPCGPQSIYASCILRRLSAAIGYRRSQAY